MSHPWIEKRFLLYQIKAIRRFQRLREPKSRAEAQQLAFEWIRRFAGTARARWTTRLAPGHFSSSAFVRAPENTAWKI